MRDLLAHPHVRFNPLRGEWVLVSPQRNARPWQGQVETVPDAETPAHDPSCRDYLAVELARGERTVCENDALVALVPFWAGRSKALSSRGATSRDWRTCRPNETDLRICSSG